MTYVIRLNAKENKMSLRKVENTFALQLVGRRGLQGIRGLTGEPGIDGIQREVTVTTDDTNAGSSSLTDYVYIISGAHTVTLPTAVGNTNRYTLKNAHSASVALAFTLGQTADGDGITLGPNDSVDLISNNQEWKII